MNGEVSKLFLYKVQIVGKRKCRQRKAVSEFTSERDEGIKMLAHSCLGDIYRIRMNWNRERCAGRKGWRFAVCKFRRQ